MSSLFNTPDGLPHGIEDVALLNEVLDEALAGAYEDIWRREQFIRRISRQKNAIQPVSRLPPELTIKIFDTLRKSDPVEKGSLRTWLNVTHVCQSWRELALNYPKFWNRIIITNDVDKLSAFINRSGNADIELVLTESYNRRLHYASDGLLQAIKEGLVRTSTMDLCLSTEYDHWRSLEGIVFHSCPLDRLKKLSLHIEERAKISMKEMKLACTWVPAVQLDELHLQRVCLPWHHSAYHGLQSLSLEDLLHFGPSVTELLSVLRHCSNIRELSLKDTKLRLAGDEEGSSLINLPYLRSLNLLNVRHGPYLVLMGHLQLDVERINEIEYRFHFKDNLFIGFPPLLPRHLQILVPDARGEIRIVVRTKDIRFEIFPEPIDQKTERRRDPALDFGFGVDLIHENKIASCIAPISELLNRTNLCRISRRCIWIFWVVPGHNQMKKSDWITLFDTVSNIQRLEFSYGFPLSAEPVDELVLALKEPRSGSETLQCPELEEITFTVVDFLHLSDAEFRAFQNLIDHLLDRRVGGRGIKRLSFLSCKGLEKLESIKTRILDAVDELLCTAS